MPTLFLLCPERKNKTLGKIVSNSVVVILLALALNGPSFAANLPPVKGGKLPVIILPIPKDSYSRSYLGLSGEGFFKISQIKAKAVLIKIFNLYCPVCQSTAAAMTELFHQIEKNPDLKDKIKLIGIGAGNSLLEVEVFKQTNHISFPVFPDEDFTIHKALGEVRTPFFIATRMNRDGSHEIVHTHLGALTEVRAFLDLMVEAYGIHQDDLQKKKKLATSTANESSSNDELELRVR
jgi:thiol-disulfide isomerase/thioredoxin